MYSNNSQICQDLAEVDAAGVPLPPYCNTGVSSTPTLPPSLPAAYFDWYSATLPGSIKFIQAFLNRLQATYPALDIEPQAKGLHGYSHSFTVKGPNGMLYAIGMYGNQAGTFTFQITGGKGFGDTLANWLREHYGKKLGDHSLARSDTRYDFDFPGAWEYLSTKLLEIRNGLPKKLQTSTVGDWLDGIKGRTLYIGSRDSSTLLRLYEKGKEDPENFGPNAVRLEVITKPAKAQQKNQAGMLTAHHLACANPIARELFKQLGEPNENPRLGTTYKEPTPMAQLANHCYKQYGKVIDYIVETAKDDPKLALEALQRIQKGLPPFPQDEPAQPIQAVADPVIAPRVYDWLQLALH